MASSIQIIDANTMFGVHPTHRLDMSVDRLVREMDRCRIAATLTLSTVGIFHNPSIGNGLTLDAAKANNRLVPVATLNPAMYFGSADDIQAIRTQGFRILKLYPVDQSWPIDSAAFGEVLKQLAPLKMPIMLNASKPGDPSAVGRMVSNYPAPVILCTVTSGVLSETLAVMSELPNVMLETHALHVPGALSMLVDRVGAERIIFGSGAPRASVPSSLYYVASADLSEQDKTHILGGNIRRILEAT